MKCENSKGCLLSVVIGGASFFGIMSWYDDYLERQEYYERQNKIYHEQQDLKHRKQETKRNLEFSREYMARKKAVADWMEEKAQNPAGHYRGELMKTNGIYYVKNLEAEVSE